MTKLFKNISFVCIVLSLIFLTACSAVGGVKPEEVLNKIADATKSIKSADFESDLTIETNEKNKNDKINVVINGTTVKNPLSEKITIKTTKNSNTEGTSEGIDEFYLKDNNLFLKSQTANSWNKYSGDLALDPYKNVSNLEASDKIIEFYKKIAKDFKASKDGDNLVLTFSGNGDLF